MAELSEQLQKAVAKLELAKARRHVFLCLGPTCCEPREGQAAWDLLKSKLKEAGLPECQRTKVGCLRICCNGPTMVVYPEGTWYEGMTKERIPRFVQEHLVGGKPIREWIFAEKVLADATDSPRPVSDACSKEQESTNALPRDSGHNP